MSMTAAVVMTEYLQLARLHGMFGVPRLDMSVLSREVHDGTRRPGALSQALISRVH